MKHMLSWMKKNLSFSHARTHANASNASFFCHTSRARPVWSETSFDTLAREGYQKNVIAYRCVNLIARSVASVPWLVYSCDQSHELDRHKVLDLLKSPSPRQAGSAFMEAVVSYLLLSGNTFIQAVYDARGDICELHPLRPDRVKILSHESGEVAAYEYRIGQQVVTFPVEEGRCAVLHLKLFNPLNAWYGFSPIEASAKAIDQHNEVANHNLSILQHGGRPSGALMLRPSEGRGVLTSEQRAALHQDLKALYEGHSNAGRMMVLEGDFEWKEMGLSPKDLDFIEGKNMSAREIAQAFGVPPMLVGVPGDATFANYKEARLHVWEDTIIPLLEFFVAEFNLWLCPQYGEDVKIGYDLDEISALAPKREKLWEKVAAASFLTINEKRAAVGYSQIKGGDRIMKG